MILDDGEPAGRVNLNHVVRGAFCSADLGYWVDESRNGRGLATAAVAALPIGVAPGYIQIAGRWQDHLLFQRLADD